MCQLSGSKVEAEGLLIPTSEPGIYVRSGRFQTILAGLHQSFLRLMNETQEVYYRSSGFIPRRDLERSEYISKFPQFVARVTPELEPSSSELVTLPSACLSLYPIIAGSRPVPEQGLLATVSAPCFRNEGHYAPERMRAFQMAEFVFFGEAPQVSLFRDQMLAAVQAWLKALGVDGRTANATDPFFGRMGEILAQRQKAANLKLELLVQTSEDMEVAALSINDHGDFFCSRWNIIGQGDAPLNSACVGVGLERLALAMFHKHGRDLNTWPHDVIAPLRSAQHAI